MILDGRGGGLWNDPPEKDPNEDSLLVLVIAISLFVFGLVVLL
jgi:hypothetical protein